MAAAGRSDYECRSSLLTAGAKAAVLSGAVTLSRADLLQHIEPLETGAATTRDLARIGTALAADAAAGDGARRPRGDARRDRS